MKHLAAILICVICLGFVAAATLMTIHGHWFMGFLSLCAAVAISNNIAASSRHDPLITTQETRQKGQAVGEGPQGSGPEV